MKRSTSVAVSALLVAGVGAAFVHGLGARSTAHSGHRPAVARHASPRAPKASPSHQAGGSERAAGAGRSEGHAPSAWRYRFEWKADDEVTLPTSKSSGGPAPSALHAQGELVLGRVQSGASGERFAFRIAQVDDIQWTLLGQPMGAQAARSLFEQMGTVVVRRNGEGGVEAVSVRKQAGELARNLALQLAAAIAWAPPPPNGTPEWSAREAAPVGWWEVHYQRTPADAAVSRQRTALRIGEAGATRRVPVESKWRGRFDDDGLPVHMEGRDELAASIPMGRWHATRLVALDRIGPASPLSAPPSPVEVAGGQAGSAAAGRDDLLRRRAAGLDRKGLFDGLATLAGGTKAAERWMWRASALLRLDPSLCDEVAAWAQQDGVGFRHTVLGAELLVATGTPRAQAALRSLVDALSPRLGARKLGQLVERVGFLSHPTAQTVDWLARAAAGNGGTLPPGSAAAALGSAVEHLGDGARRDGVLAQLRQLALSPDVPRSVTVGALLGLGNSGDARALDVLSAAADSREPLVRQTVARAAGHFASVPRARELLGALARDDDPSTRALAQRALLAGGLQDGDLTTVEQWLDGGILDARLERNVLRAVLERASAHPSARAQRVLRRLAETARDASVRRQVLAALHSGRANP